MLGFFNFKKKKVSTINETELKEIIDYSNLIDITKILTEDNKAALEAITLLVTSKSECNSKFPYRYRFYTC